MQVNDVKKLLEKKNPEVDFELLDYLNVPTSFALKAKPKETIYSPIFDVSIPENLAPFFRYFSRSYGEKSTMVISFRKELHHRLKPVKRIQ